jgi:hypothetical protein
MIRAVKGEFQFQLVFVGQTKFLGQIGVFHPFVIHLHRVMSHATPNHGKTLAWRSGDTTSVLYR